MQVELKSNELYDQIIASAKRVGQLAEQETLFAEQNCNLPDSVINAIIEEKINRLIIPKEYGYPQIDFTTFADMVKTVGYYNLSAAWVTYFYALHNAWVALLPKHRMDEIYADGGLLADIFAPTGHIEEVAGGVILNGKWNFVSGIKNSGWVGVGVLRHVSGSDMPAHYLLAVKVSDIEIVEDWDSLGLRGSGSHTIIVRDLFVPEDMLINLNDILINKRPNDTHKSEDYLYYNTSFFPAFFVGFPAMSIGAAERIVDEFIDRTKKRVRLDGTNEGHTPKGQRVAAELSIKLCAAKGMMREYVDMLETDNGQYDPSEYNMIRVKIIRECVDLAVLATSSIGASGLKRGTVFEVMTRDLITISTHVTSLFEDGIFSYGKFLFGLPHTSRG